MKVPPFLHFLFRTQLTYTHAHTRVRVHVCILYYILLGFYIMYKYIRTQSHVRGIHVSV